MILVTGATGGLGSKTIEILINLGTNPTDIKALVRDTSKADRLVKLGVNIIEGNYDDYDSLLKAFDNVDKLLFISGNDVMNRLSQHINVVNAAKEAKVKHIIFTSFVRKNESETSPLGMVAKSQIETDNAIKVTGIPYTILRNGLYAEAMLMFFGEHVLNNGIFLPAGDGKVAFITRDDLAEATAKVLITEGHSNKEYNLTSDINYSLGDIASILSEISNKTVNYHNPSNDDFNSTMTKAGVDGGGIIFMTMFSEAIKHGEFEVENSDFENLAGRKATRMEDFLRVVYSK